MKKSKKQEMIKNIVVAGEMAKTALSDELGPDTIDFIVGLEIPTKPGLDI